MTRLPSMTFNVRQTDTAGNTRAKNAAQIVTDMTALSAPTFALNADTGSSNSDGITNDATVNVTLANGAASCNCGRRFEQSTGSNMSFELADNTTFAINDDCAPATQLGTLAVAKQCDQIRYDSALCANIALNAATISLIVTIAPMMRLLM